MRITKDILIRAREISKNLSQGINPLDNKLITDADFLNDPKMIRYFSFISEVLTNEIEGTRKKLKRFYISQDEVKLIKLPDGDITISMFVEAVNTALNLGERKPLAAITINSQLKKMGLLKTELDSVGKNSTRVTEEGKRQGIKETEVERTDRNYFRILYTEVGKKFLLNNIIKILNYRDENVPIHL